MSNASTEREQSQRLQAMPSLADRRGDDALERVEEEHVEAEVRVTLHRDQKVDRSRNAEVSGQQKQIRAAQQRGPRQAPLTGAMTR